jgi:D-alanine-D-alanine ligase
MSKRVLVLRGGPSEEHKVSLESGRLVVDSLQRQGYKVRDVTVTHNGEWLESGRVKSIRQSLHDTDVVFLTIHGSFGEDGQVQRLLGGYSIPYVGSSALPSALAFNKSIAKSIVREAGVLTPESVLISRSTLDTNAYSMAANIKSSFGPEYIVKPVASGSSLGVSLVRHGESLAEAIIHALADYESILVEQFIRGREATVSVIGNYRGSDLYVFPAVEIIPYRDEPFFTATAKYNGQTTENCPGNFSYGERDVLSEYAISAHKALGLSQLSRSDFIVDNGRVYYLETNTIPGLTKESLFPKAAAAGGMTYDQLISHLVETAD